MHYVRTHTHAQHVRYVHEITDKCAYKPRTQGDDTRVNEILQELSHSEGDAKQKTHLVIQRALELKMGKHSGEDAFSRLMQTPVST
jgi:hypothetical protein